MAELVKTQGGIPNRAIITATGTDYVFPANATVNYYLSFTRDATARTITLPDPTNASYIGNVITISVLGVGVGNVTLQTPSGENIYLTDKSTKTSLTWNGTGSIDVMSNGTDFEVVSHGIWDTFKTGDTPGNGRIQKNADGNATYKGYDFTVGNSNPAAQKTLTLPFTPSGINYITGGKIGYKDSSDPTTIVDFTQISSIAAEVGYDGTNIYGSVMEVSGNLSSSTRRYGYNVFVDYRW